MSLFLRIALLVADVLCLLAGLIAIFILSQSVESDGIIRVGTVILTLAWVVVLTTIAAALHRLASLDFRDR